MSSTNLVSDILTNGFQQLGLKLDVEPFLTYLTLLQKWNNAYNLTAIRDPEEMAIRHILDSLAILPMINGKKLLDVGSGAGFPGIPLALACPSLHIVLLDSNGKKTRFLEESKRNLALKNIEVIQTRVESYRPSFSFDTLTSRAFSEISQFLKWTQHLIAPNGIWLAMKGRDPKAELADIERPYQINNYRVPGLDSERCCVIIKNTTKEL